MNLISQFNCIDMRIMMPTGLYNTALILCIVLLLLKWTHWAQYSCKMVLWHIVILMYLMCPHVSHVSSYILIYPHVSSCFLTFPHVSSYISVYSFSDYGCQLWTWYTTSVTNSYVTLCLHVKYQLRTHCHSLHTSFV